jgi:hypothetical protein
MTMTEQKKSGIDVVADRGAYMSTTKDRHYRLVIPLSSISHQLFLSRIKQLSPACALLKKAVQIKAKKTYRILCDRSEAEVLCNAAKKYCPEAVSEIDAVIQDLPDSGSS